MAEDPLAKYGHLRNWEWWQPKPRRPRQYDEPGGHGRAQAKAAAAGYSSVEEWEAAGWPHPTDPDTGSPYEGYKIDRMERGRHPDGRKMADEDWFDIRTQNIFDYLKGAQVYSTHYDWAEQMRAKYPNYPMPGINMDDLLRQMFPDWYDGEEPPTPAAPREVPLPTPETMVSMIPPGIQQWMARLGMEVPGVEAERVRRPPEDRALPMYERTEAEREEQRRAIRGREIAKRAIGPDWAGYVERAERKPTTWGEYLRAEEGEVAPPPEARPPREGMAELIERAKVLVREVAVARPLIRPEVVAAAEESVLVNLPTMWEIVAQVRRETMAGAIPSLAAIERARPGTMEQVIATSLLPAEWAEVGLSKVYLQRLHIVKAGEVPEEWKGNVEAEAGYELGHLLGDLDEKTRGMMVNWIARIGWSPFQHQLAAAKRILDPKEYEGWALYEGELVQIEPGIPLAEGYAAVEMYDPDVITQILRREEHPLAEWYGRTLVDPLKILYIGAVQRAPGAVWRRLVGKRTPARYARGIFTDYYGPGVEVPAYVDDFLQSAKGKPVWLQNAFVDNIRDLFQPLASRYAAWKVRGAPAVIMGIPDQVGDFSSYMRAAAKAEGEVRRFYALVYPRLGTSDPNFLQVIAKAMSGGLGPAQLREMRVLVIEADNYRAIGNMEGAAEKVAALEKLAKEGLPLRERWKLLWKLSRTKAGSMALNRDTPSTSREIMADNAIRVLGWLFEDMESGIDRAVTALLLKKDPGALLKESKMRFINSAVGLDAFMLLQHIRDDSLGSLVHATGIPSTNIQGGWTALHEAFRRIAGTYYYPAPREDPWQKMIGWFYKIAPRTFLSTPRYPIQNIVSNFTNIWARYGWVTPRTDASSLDFINRFTGDAGFLPPGFARSITAAGEVSTERTPTLLGRKWVYEGPTARRRDPPSEEAIAAAIELGRKPGAVEWAARLVKKGAEFLPLQEGWIDLSRWGERNASMVNYRDMVENLKGEFGRPRRGFLPGLPESEEASAAMRAASDEIVASSLNWGEVIERHAKLYGVERIPKAAHYVSTERIRNLGAECIEVADDLMEALSMAPSKTAFRRRYRLIKDGINKQVKEWVSAEPDFPEEVELRPAPLEGLSPEQAQRLMALTGTSTRNRGHINNARRILVELADRNTDLPIKQAYRMADIAIDKAMRNYAAAGAEADRMKDYFWSVINDGRLWPAFNQKIVKMHATAHQNIDKEIYNTAIGLGGDPATLMEELEVMPWGGLPADLADRKMRALQDDIINSTYEMQALELPLAPEGVEFPPIDSIKAIKEWAQGKPLAANAWLEYMREAIKDKQIAEAAERVARVPAEEIRRARRASWTEGTAREIELMEQKITRLQEEIATSPVEAADVEQLMARQQELYEWSMELQGMKETLTGLPSQREVFRFWDYKKGDFRYVKDPSGRVAEFAQSQVVQEIAGKHYGFEQSARGAEQFGDLIKERLAVSDRIAALENLIWEDPEIILPETAEGLEAFITQSEPQLAEMMHYEREPSLFQSGLRAYEEAIDRLAKIRAGEAMPESEASSIESAKTELAGLERQREAIRMEAIARNRLAVSTEEQVMLAQDLEALNEQYVAKGIVTRNRLGQGDLFETLEELRERGLLKRTVRAKRKADKARGIEKIGYQHYYYILTDQGRDAVKGISVARFEEVPKPVPPGSEWVEPVGVEGVEAGPPVTAAEQAALFGAPKDVGIPRPEVPAPQLPGLEAGELYGGREIPMEIPEAARERPLPLEMEIEGLTPEEAERIAMEKGAVPMPGVEMTEIQRQQRISDVESLISEGETRLKTGKDIIGGDLTPEAIEDTQRTLESYKAELARLQVAPEAVAPEVALPEGWTMEVGKTRVKDGVAARAEWDWEGKRLIFADEEAMRDPGIVRHEIAHVRFHEMPDAARKALVSDYIKVADITEKEIEQRVYNEWLPMDYGEYLVDPSKVKPEVAAVFEKHFPEAEAIVPEGRTADVILDAINATHARIQARRGTGQEVELAAAQADLARLAEEFKAAGGMEAVTAEAPFKVGQEVIVGSQRLVPATVPLKEGEQVTVVKVTPEGNIIVERPGASREVQATLAINALEPNVFLPVTEPIEPRVAPKPELPKPAEILREEGVLPGYGPPEEPARVPMMLTNAHREALRALGYSDAMIGQMTPEQGLGLIEGRLKDFVPTVETPMGPMMDVVMPPSPREGAELKRDMLLQRMDEWYKDALKEYGKEIEGADPTNFENVERWLEDELRGFWAQFKIYQDKMGEATTAWTLHSYRKKNIDTLMYRAFFWPYWQTRTGYKWAKTLMANPSKLADWARWHDTHRKINDDLPENFRDSVHIPDWIPVIGGQYWNAYWFFDPIYPWVYGLEDLIPDLRKDGWKALLGLFPRKLPISPLIGMTEAMEPMITEEGRRLEPITPWSRAVYEKFGINIEAALVKALETGYSEVKPSIYRGLERGGRAVGRPGLAERALGGPEVIPVIPEGRYEPYHISMRIIDMWISGSITEDQMLESMAEREGDIWDAAYALTRQGRGTTEFTSIATGIRPRELLPAHYEIEEFKRRRGMLRTMEEGPEKRAYREEIYEDFPFARQWDVRYDSAESARMERTISDAWQDIENEAVISDKKLVDAIRERPGDLNYVYKVKTENREREEDKRSFWRRQGVSFVFNPRTRTYEEIEDWVKGRILSQFYYHLPQADKFKDEEGAIDWDTYNEAVEAFWEALPDEIVNWGDVQQMDLEIRDAVGKEVFVLKLAKEIATEEAYDVWRKANDLPEEALNYTWKKYIIDVANEYYQDELKDLEYDERNIPAFFAEFGQKTAEELIAYILQEYPDRWIEEELTETLAGIRMPGIWERWNQDADDKSIGINLLWTFWGGQTGLGRRRMKELINDPIYNEFFVDKETRDYDRVTPEDLEKWIKALEKGIPNPWDDREGSLKTLYYWNVDSTGDPLLYPREEEPEARGRAPRMAAPPPEPPEPGEPTLGGLEQPGGRPLPWSYYQRVGRMVDVPENFWDWITQEYPIKADWRERVEATRPMVDLKTEWGGYAGGGDIVSRRPFRAGAKYVWKHELGHYMDHFHMSSVSQQPEWQEALKRWRDDPQYPRGRDVWSYITGGHPHGSEEKPSWLEGYAQIATYPFALVPSYIRGFYPWRDWKELEATEKRRQVRLTAAGGETGQGAEYGQEIAAQGLPEDELARMWEDYQNPEYPIAALVFAWAHDKAGSPQETRGAWEKIPEEQRYAALEWFFDELWPNAQSYPERFGTELKFWQNVKEFLDFIGIVDVRQKERRGGRPPGLAAPMPLTPEAPPTPLPLEPPPPEEEEEAPSEAPRTIPQLAGTSESAQYARAQDEMAAWVAAGKEGDWTPLMEQWFGKDTPAGFFWEYYWAEIPPGRIADDVRQDPIIQMLLSKAFRTVYEVKGGVYEAALETLQGWREAHPELPGDPKEWAIVRQISKKYWELKEAGEQNEARAIWIFFATLLEPYWPSKKAVTKRRRGFRARGGSGRGRRQRRGASLRRWRRWAMIRQYPTR